MNYILDFVDTITEQQLEQYLLEKEITVIKQFDAFGHVYLCSTNSELVSDELLISFVADDDNNNIELLSFNIDLKNDTEKLKSIDVDDEKNWWKVASIANIDYDQNAHTHSVRGSLGTIYIVDSGIEIDHPDFLESSIDLLHSFTGEFSDTNGHGTAIASVMSGNTCSLTNTNLKIVKIFDNNTGTRQSDLITAFNNIIHDFNTNGKTTSIVNLSWSIPHNEYVNSKIQYMIDSGLYVVCSSGNSGVSIENVTPACIPDVIAVGSFGQNLEPSNFTNYTGGSMISFTENENNYGELAGWAPGEMIWSAGLNGTYGYVSGTSISAAIASSILIYNLSAYIDVDQNYIEVYRDSLWKMTPKIVAMKSLLFRRQNILQLEGNYSNSVNQIATLITNNKINNNINIYKIQAGSRYLTLYASPLEYKSLSCEHSLPSYMTITDKGYIDINYNDIENNYEILPEVIFNLIDHNDNVKTNTVKVIVYKQEMSYTDVITEAMADDEDPLLQLLLQSSCGWTGSVCEGSCENFPKECKQIGKGGPDSCACL